ncbi:MAG: VOC family protein [Bacillota bacterium]|nr:VOC family protein [Bacillota bacterium]
MNYFKDEYRTIFYVEDYEANVNFYGNILELESNYSWNDAPDDRGIKYLAAGGVVEIVRREPPMPQGLGSIMIEAKNVNECYEAISKKPGVVFTEHLADRPYGVRVFRLLDPNGNDVIIFSYLKDLKK